jgi:hypothetical protein
MLRPTVNIATTQLDWQSHDHLPRPKHIGSVRTVEYSGLLFDGIHLLLAQVQHYAGWQANWGSRYKSRNKWAQPESDDSNYKYAYSQTAESHTISQITKKAGLMEDPAMQGRTWFAMLTNSWLYRPVKYYK